jgi:hypothetical protein
MSMHSRVTLPVVLALFLTGLTTPSGAGVPSSSWCTDDASPPCVDSATLNGSTAYGNTDWTISVTGGPDDFLWNVFNETVGSYDLGSAALTDRWVITFDTGTSLPRVSFMYGMNSVTTRSSIAGPTYQITVDANPVRLTDNDECDPGTWPWTCPETATDEFAGYLGGQITDYGTWDDVAQRESMWGMNYATNIGLTSMPPEIVNDPVTGVEQLLLRLANHHYWPGGVDVFEGFVDLRIPNKFLRETYGIDNPATMTSSGLVVTGDGSAATATVSQESSGDAMLVDIDGMRFSARAVRIKRGVITPTRPKNILAIRTRARRGKVKFGPATARGSRITGYKARCVPRKGSDVESASGSGSPLVVTGLRRGVAYDCRVRALSKAGAGKWSVSVKMPAKPA